MSCHSILVTDVYMECSQLGDFMLLQGGGTSKRVNLQGGETGGWGDVWIKGVLSNHFCVDVYLEYTQTG